MVHFLYIYSKLHHLVFKVHFFSKMFGFSHTQFLMQQRFPDGILPPLVLLKPYSFFHPPPVRGCPDMLKDRFLLI